MIKLVIGVLIFTATWTATAADIAQYKVELIIFENLDPAALQAEHWPADPGTPPLVNAKELDALIAAAPSVSIPATNPMAATSSTAGLPSSAATASAPPSAPVLPGWQRLTPSALSLKWAATKLSNSKRYRPLLHIGWVQPLDSSDQGTSVHIYDGLDLQQIADTNPAQAQNSGAQALPHVIDGTFTLKRGRFLHVDADVGYRKTYTPEPTTPDGSATQPVTLYVRMNQSRRIRDNELNYFDHPLIGVLFVVSPYVSSAANIQTK